MATTHLEKPSCANILQWPLQQKRQHNEDDGEEVGKEEMNDVGDKETFTKQQLPTCCRNESE